MRDNGGRERGGPDPRTPRCGWIPLALAVLLGCGDASEVSPPVSETARESPSAVDVDSATGPQAAGSEAAQCPPGEESGFADPAEAFAHYARAINAGDWCRAIHSFAPDARAAVALANFKSLVLLAGGEHPRRAESEEAFRTFCEAHGLPYARNQESRLRLVVSVMNNAGLDAELAEIARLAEESPEDSYADVMRALVRADPDAITPFELPLQSLESEGDQARGVAVQAGERKSPVWFVRGDSGWFLHVQ